MKSIIYTVIGCLSFILVPSELLFSQNYVYQSDSAHFSIEFKNKPIIKKEKDNTDIQYEDEDSQITYILGYKKNSNGLSGEQYCKKVEERMKSREEVNIASTKIVDFKGIPALRSQTSEEHRYILFSYISYDFTLNGFDITIMIMSKEEGLMLKDIKKFAESFELIK